MTFIRVKNGVVRIDVELEDFFLIMKEITCARQLDGKRLTFVL